MRKAYSLFKARSVDQHPWATEFFTKTGKIAAFASQKLLRADAMMQLLRCGTCLLLPFDNLVKLATVI